MTPRLMMFDLDGTLIDSRVGIEHSLKMTLQENGVEVEADHDFSWCIGTSLWKIFEHYLGTTDPHKVDAAVARYRHIYRDGPMFEYELYDGILDSLKRLQQGGVRLVIATAKAHEYAREVVAITPFASLISHVYGSELDGTNVEKRDLIHHILKEEKLSPDEAVMVGDRHHDVDGARANGVNAIGVSYGYGTREELQRATAIIDSAHDLPGCVESLEVEYR